MWTSPPPNNAARSIATKQSREALTLACGLLRYARDDDVEPSMKQPAVYIVASKRNGTLYTGVTSNLIQRAYQHRESLIPGFTANHGCKSLV